MEKEGKRLGGHDAAPAERGVQRWFDAMVAFEGPMPAGGPGPTGSKGCACIQRSHASWGPPGSTDSGGMCEVHLWQAVLTPRTICFIIERLCAASSCCGHVVARPRLPAQPWLVYSLSRWLTKVATQHSGTAACVLRLSNLYCAPPSGWV